MAVELLRPWWLLALPAALLLFALGARAGAALGDWRRAIDPALLGVLAARGHLLRGRRFAAVAPCLLALLLALALSGPARERDAARTYRNLDGLVIAFDVSRSVASGGSLPAARLAAAAAARAAAPRPVALIAYAGDAYLAQGFTTDPAAQDAMLAALDGDTVPDAGSRPERALALAGKLLRQNRILHGDVLLVSDGGGVAAPATLAEARSLVAEGHAVHALFVPATDSLPDGAPAPDFPAMEVLAQAGGGAVARLASPDAMLRRLAERPAARLARGDFAALAWRDLGPWLLALALLPAAALFRRRAT